MKHLIIPLVFLSGLATGQPVYNVPFGSSGNMIELTVENSSTILQSGLTVKAIHTPSWLHFEQPNATITELSGGAQQTARFSFSVDKAAPINSEQTVTFTVTGSSGQEWTKLITLKVSPPQSFELFQNYPNPFNPVTTIAYQLPSESKVSLLIYNLLGQVVTTLVNADRVAGFHQEVWDASTVSSGLYVYRITATDKSGNQVVRNKTMSLIR